MKIEELGHDSDTMAQIDDITEKLNEIIEQSNRQEDALLYLSVVHPGEYPISVMTHVENILSGKLKNL